MTTEVTIRHQPPAQRFAARLEGKIAYLSYDEPEPGVLDFAHVYVPPEHREQGIAGQLTRTALEWARNHGYSVIPSCPYVSHYVHRNPEYSSLIR